MRANVTGEIELTGRGITYCAICDGPIFAGQRVAIVGGGNSALETARQAHHYLQRLAE